MSAPLNFPETMRPAFTQNGQIPIYEWYINEVVSCGTVKWDNELISRYIKEGGESYGGASKFHYDAFNKYIDHIKDKSVAVIGSQKPWIEAILCNVGAKKITTVEFNVPIVNHNIITACSYDEFCKSDNKYDAIVSYSSIEHSGLGRYGDQLNPNGDIEAMCQIHKHLKTDGHVFLGVPVGKDYLVWNAHRIYGELRLKLLIEGFDDLEWFGVEKTYLQNCSQPKGNPIYDKQPVIVLKKNESLLKKYVITNDVVVSDLDISEDRRGAGYNLGDLLNMPSLGNFWSLDPHNDLDRMILLGSKYERSVLSIYCKNRNKKDVVPDISLIRNSVKQFILENSIEKLSIMEIVKDPKTLCVHVRSGDSPTEIEFKNTIKKASTKFNKVILMSGLHLDTSYADNNSKINNFKETLNEILQFNSNIFVYLDTPDMHLSTFMMASNVLLHKGGFSCLASIVSTGNVFATQLFHHATADTWLRLVNTKLQIL